MVVAFSFCGRVTRETAFCARATLSFMRPLLLGHRGARRACRENTLAAFQRALEHGCDGFEFDVRHTADAQSILCHDAKLAGRSVARSEFGALLQAYRRRNPDCGENECPPSLEAVLRRFSPAFLDIELKVGGGESAVLQLLRAYPPQRYVVSSFLPQVIRRCRELDSALRLGLICDKRSELAKWESLPVDNLFAHHRLADPALLGEVHAAGKKLFLWTVNDAKEMRRWAERGVDGIISDDTELLAGTLGGY